MMEERFSEGFPCRSFGMSLSSPLSPARDSHLAVKVGPRDAVPPAPVDLDESLLRGCKRRLREFLVELRRPEAMTAWASIAALCGMLVYSYWPGLMNAKSSWDNPQYSHGWIVPLFAAALLFWWRQPVAPVTVMARLAGIGLLVVTFALRLWCASYRIVTIDMYTFVPALAGIFLLVGGWQMFRWAWAPIAFLIFMYPLPDEATRYLLGPLQTLATMVSTYALQTLGLDAYREGNQIILGDMHLGVVDACSGLRMLTIFGALSVALVLLGNREWWENVIILASAVPIALIVNSTRITVTGVMYTINPEIAEKIFHDWAGYFMMPLALAMLFLEQQLLANLVVTEEVAPTTVTAGLGSKKPVQTAVLRASEVGLKPGIAGPEKVEKLG